MKIIKKIASGNTAAFLANADPKTINGALALNGSVTLAGLTRRTGAAAVPETPDTLMTAAQTAAVHPTLTQVLGSLIRQWEWINGSATAASGGSAIATSQFLNLVTITTAGSQVYYQFAPWAGGLGGTHARRVRWGDRFRRMSFRVSCETMGLVNATATALICLGKNVATGAGELAANGVALRLIGNGTGGAVLWGVVHNGTALSTVNLGVSIIGTHTTALIDIISNGSGTVTFFVDGVLRGTLTGGPTSNTSSTEVAMTAEVIGNGNICIISVSTVNTLIA